MSNIEWTDRTWNPSIGCAKVSAGCKHCYAEKMAGRIARMQKGSPYLRVLGIDTQSCVPVEEDVSSKWNGRAVFLPERLSEPLKWRKPSRIFVDSMSDLFHDDITFEQIAAVFGVMAASPRHTFQVLTKRPARMLEFFERTGLLVDDGFISTERCDEPGHPLGEAEDVLHEHGRDVVDAFNTRNIDMLIRWPLPNVHLGVSVEHQKAYNERVPLLLQCPAALHFLSMEPLLEPIGMTAIELARVEDIAATLNPLTGHIDGPDDMISSIGWVIVGGESGPDARLCSISWIESVIDQCTAEAVPVFVKQLGACPDGVLRLKDRKGGDMDEWPESLKVRQFPLDDVRKASPGDRHRLREIMEDDQP